ncbi:MAG: adenosine deaminase [Actinomycetota bacterium]
MRDLRALPKAELHVHMEGSIRIDTARELAERGGAKLPHGLTGTGWAFRDHLDFIDNYVELCTLLTRLEDFHRIAVEFCEDLAANGVRYAEAVFSPSNHAGRMGGDWFGPIEAVLDGLEAGRRGHGVTVRLCPDVVRDLGMDDGERVLEVALRYAGRGVVALGAAGSERTVVQLFAPLFERAKAEGLKSVPHAGEWAGPQNVWDTLRFYQPDRIGHGVRAVDDPELVEELARRRIPLEVSPVSNVATGAYPSLDAHPFLRLREAGVVVTLNSDDPPMFGAWLADVYEAARAAWDLTDEELADLARTAVRASFADDVTKAAIVREIDGWLLAPVPETAS